MKLDELKRLHEAATPGPWDLGEWSDNQQGIDTTATEVRLEYVGWESMILCNGCEDSPREGKLVAKGNAALIAAMRNALPDLIAAVEALRAMADEVNDGATLFPTLQNARAILSRLGVE